MALRDEVLKKAKAAAVQLAEAEQKTQIARSEYHAIVRRMHLAGGSLREIAEALGLSHQRVQQMVGAAGGSWWQHVWRWRNVKQGAACTFCARPQDQVGRLIAGPKVFICGACVATADRQPGKETSNARCSFCRKGRTPDRPLLMGPSAHIKVLICGECLSVCRQILSDCAA